MSAIYLVRHGQASFGAKDYDDLSALGQQQSEALGAALAARALRPAVVICGRLRRHRQTAAACLAAMRLPEDWDEDPCWNEYDHNEVLAALDPAFRTQSGIAAAYATHADPRQAFQAIFAKAIAHWTSGLHEADYRETWSAFNARVEQGLAALCARLARGEDALVFTSGGVISVIARKLLRLPDEQAFRLNWSILNASVTKLVIGASGPRLLTLNEHGHLEGRVSAQGQSLLSYR